MNKRILKGKKGFTLIELIVVIAILAVLAMLALPTFSGLISESKASVQEANARTVYTAAKAYLALNQPTGNISGAALEAYLGDNFDGKDGITVTIENGEIKSISYKGESYTPSDFTDGKAFKN